MLAAPTNATTEPTNITRVLGDLSAVRLCLEGGQPNSFDVTMASVGRPLTLFPDHLGGAEDSPIERASHSLRGALVRCLHEV